ncbi:MAG TPA: hypothetical protein PKK11_06035 [Methanothrix sp.]|nr:hypothetical protein [Methanothrix sp.]HPT19393.1 hypothetical protein [Methanothrix sp.]
MKKILAVLAVLFAVIGLSAASGPQGIHEPGTGIVSPETKASAQGSGQGINSGEEKAAGGPQGVHEPGTGIANPELKEEARGTGQALSSRAENATNETAAEARAQPGFMGLAGLLAISGVSLVHLKRRR